MTPVAHRVISDMTLPKKKRRFSDPNGMLPHLRQEFHCFETTAVVPTAFDLWGGILDAKFPSIDWSFLPAPRTWIEYREQLPKGSVSSPDTTWRFTGDRMAFLLVERPDGYADVFMTFDSEPNEMMQNPVFGANFIGRIALLPALERLAPTLLGLDRRTAFDSVQMNLRPSELEVALFPDAWDRKPECESPMVQHLWLLYAFLLLINTPHVTQHTHHDPHRGLARQVANDKLLGIFPLRAWTEITLRAGITITDQEDGDPTGRTMPLHWTRAHRKRVYGVWTLIRDYWSGDASIGIKRSRYKVVP